MMKMPAGKFEDITHEARLRSPTMRLVCPDYVFKNNHFVVQIFKNERVLFGKVMSKMMIRRNDSEPIREWHVLQRIKTEILGAEVMAIQVFPKESELVDVANLYWLFFEDEL